jgi:hypothetical protein
MPQVRRPEPPPCRGVAVSRPRAELNLLAQSWVLAGAEGGFPPRAEQTALRQGRSGRCSRRGWSRWCRRQERRGRRRRRRASLLLLLLGLHRTALDDVALDLRLLVRTQIARDAQVLTKVLDGLVQLAVLLVATGLVEDEIRVAGLGE